MKVISLALTTAFLTISSDIASAQALKVIHAFTPAPYTGAGFTNWDGAHPYGSLVTIGSTLYGTTEVGGAGMGTVFSVQSDGSVYTVLHTFAGGSDGSAPYSGLIASGSTLFGTTPGGAGTIYSISASGSGYQVLHMFNTNLDGGGPDSALAVSGTTLYGTTQSALFSMNTDGSGFQWIHSFSAMSYNPTLKLYTNSDGSSCMGSLTVSGNVVYGTTYQGGANGCGTVFAMNTDGSNFIVLHAFTGGADAANPWTGLLLSAGTLYGTAYYGGTNSGGVMFAIGIDGRNYTVLHDFGSSGDGMNPRGNLILRGGMLYGTTSVGGSGGAGTVFSIRTNGNCYTVVHSLESNSEGQLPEAGLSLSANVLYGTATTGSTNASGSIFGVSLPGTAIVNFGIQGTSLIVNVTNGIPGGGYTVLASANILAPMNQWSEIATGAFDANGNSMLVATNAVNPGVSRGFFRLRMQ
jgi:uncharacterized repeat protein (TIGR03803 family)